MWRRGEGQVRGGGLCRAVGQGRKALWPKLHCSRFLLEAGRNDINQLALNAIVLEIFESSRAWGSVGGRSERVEESHVRELTAEPVLELRSW